MEDPLPWIAIALGVSALGILLTGAWVLWHIRAQSVPLSSEERAEWSGTPLTPLQKTAWWGLLTGIVECLALAALFAYEGGAAVYWEDHAMRLQVVAIFLAGMVLHALLMALASARADERDRRALSWAPQFQAVSLLLGLAAWNVYLGQSFRDQGAVPMVYNYLTFGSLVILYMIAWFAGVLLGSRFSRFSRFHAQG